jgi:WD40 repeat protein
VAALGNQTIEVLDVENGKRLRTLGDLAEPQGVYYDSSTNRLFVGCRKDGTTKVFSADTYELLETATFSGNVDNIRYDARGRRIVVGYGSGSGALGFLDLNGKKTGSIPLDGHPESFQLEKSGNRVFVNVPDREEIEVADVVRIPHLPSGLLRLSFRGTPKTSGLLGREVTTLPLLVGRAPSGRCKQFSVLQLCGAAMKSK